jgi:hypothetical protein
LQIDQELLFQYFTDTLDATVAQLKSEGKFDSGIVTIKVLCQGVWGLARRGIDRRAANPWPLQVAVCLPARSAATPQQSSTVHLTLLGLTCLASISLHPQGRSCKVVGKRPIHSDAVSGGEVQHVEISLDRGLPWEAALAFKCAWVGGW